MKSSEILCVICCCLILVQNRHGYQIDFENGENRIHLESTAVRDGKIVNEPKVEEVISKRERKKTFLSHNIAIILYCFI